MLLINSIYGRRRPYSNSGEEQNSVASGGYKTNNPCGSDVGEMDSCANIDSKRKHPRKVS